MVMMVMAVKAMGRGGRGGEGVRLEVEVQLFLGLGTQSRDQLGIISLSTCKEEMVVMMVIIGGGGSDGEEK